MNYKLKIKSWLWYFTFPFAHANYTTIGETIYHPKNKIPSQSIIDHEVIHIKQQKEVGIVKYLFLYLFCFPFVYNPCRYKWEFEAYKNGSKLPESLIKRKLSSYQYGWLMEAK